MKEESKKKLDSLFTNLRTQEEKIKEVLETKKTEEEKFIEDFESLCKNEIEPKMLEFQKMLFDNGYGCKITISEENRDLKGFYSEPNIKLQISKNSNSNFYSSDDYPHIIFFGSKIDRKIKIHENTISQSSGGSAGMKQQIYTIETLSQDKIEKEILESIENILGNKY